MLPILPFYYVFISTSGWLKSLAIINDFHKIVEKLERSSLNLILSNHVLAHTVMMRLCMEYLLFH